MKSDFLSALLGPQSTGQFLALVFFALLGATLSLLLHTANRDVTKPATPVDFSTKYLVSDNWRRCLAALMLIYLALRFSPQLLGVEINEFWAVAIGLSTDQLAQLIKNKTNILGSKKDS